MKFSDIFKNKVKSLEDKLVICEGEHRKLQKELDKLKNQSPEELIKIELISEIDSYYGMGYCLGKNSVMRSYYPENYQIEYDDKKQKIINLIDELIKIKRD